MNLADSFRAFLARGIVKAMQITLVPEWARTQYMVPTFRALCDEGVKANGIVHACVGVHTFHYPEPRLKVYRKTNAGLQEVTNHEVGNLLENPNPQMGQGALLQYIALYKVIGGNCYLYKVRSRAGRVVELWPLNDAQITPVAGGEQLIDHYDWYDEESGETKKLPADDFVHLKWMPDPLAPWRGLAPLVAVAREVDCDNEARRYVFALLKNDAIPRMAMVIPARKEPLSPEQIKRLKTEFREKYGGDQRGSLAILEGGVDLKRIGLDMQELAFEAMSRVPEARIPASFRVPVTLAGMNVGLDSMIRENVKGLRRQFVEDTLTPLWRLDGDELSRSLLYAEYPGSEKLVIAFDTSEVIALQEAIAEKRTAIDAAVKGGYLTVAGAQAALGLQVDPEGNYYLRSPMMTPVPFGEPPVPPQLPEPPPEEQPIEDAQVVEEEAAPEQTPAAKE